MAVIGIKFYKNDDDLSTCAQIEGLNVIAPDITDVGGYDYSRSGYSFVNWNTSSDGTGTSYSVGDTISRSNASEVYAIWEVVVPDVEISYKGNTIATMDASGTKTLETSGKYCEDDITVTYVKPGGGINLQSKTATPSGATQTITADSGYDGLDTVTVNPITLKNGVLLPAAELVQTYSYNKLFVTDEHGTIPSYTTTATTLITGSALSPTIQLDLVNYDYLVLIRGLAIPIYNTTTKEKGRTVYTTFAGGYEIINTPANTFYDGSKYYNKNYVAAHGLASTIRNCYWSSATAVAPTTSGCGVYFAQVTPTFSSNTVTNPTLTIKSPSFLIRGSASIFTSSAWSKMTDIRFQYKIEVYRIAKSTYNLDGWGFEQQTLKIINDYYNNNGTLT